MKKPNPPGWRTAKKERTAYGSYFLGQNMIYTFPFMFLTTYLLMSGISPIKTAGILALLKVWDAVNDALFGGLIDGVRFKKGKFIPWLRISLPIILIATLALFHIPGSFSENGKLIWFAVAYLIWDTSYTLCDVPIFGLITTMTDNQDERTSLMTTGRIYANIGVIIAMICGYVLPTEMVGLSFSATSIIIVVLALVCMLFICATGKEHTVKAAQTEESFSLRRMFSYLIHNKFLLIYYLGMLLYSGLNTAASVLQFACFYLFNSAMVATLVGALSFAPAVVISFIMPKMLKRFDKYKLFMVGAVAYAVLSVIAYFVGPILIPQIIIIVLRGVALGIMSVLQFMFTPDCAEYGQYKTGIEAKGITFAVQTFTQKLNSAISAALGVAVLGIFGWVSVEAENFAQLQALNVTQTPQALDALWAVFALIPAIGGVAAVVVWSLYRLSSADAALMAKYNNGEITKEECDRALSRKY
ncbi:MAG: MFS transporter [Oscillospiraceae bacterium]|nr:MFS transporter [Oscillospiraceae bacterium]